MRPYDAGGRTMGNRKCGTVEREPFTGFCYTFSDHVAATPSEPSGKGERREFYRITVLLPMCLQMAEGRPKPVS